MAAATHKGGRSKGEEREGKIACFYKHCTVVTKDRSGDEKPRGCFLARPLEVKPSSRWAPPETSHVICTRQTPIHPEAPSSMRGFVFVVLLSSFPSTAASIASSRLSAFPASSQQREEHGYKSVALCKSLKRRDSGLSQRVFATEGVVWRPVRRGHSALLRPQLPKIHLCCPALSLESMRGQVETQWDVF